MRRVLHTSRSLAVFGLALALSACSAPSLSNAEPSAVPAAQVRQATSSSGDLLYIAAHRYIETFTYPAGTAVASMDTGYDVVALCSDAQGNVFAPGTQPKSKIVGTVREYAHGSKQPLATLHLPVNQIPVDCSSDPSTGNLAVTSYSSVNFAPQVNVYVQAAGNPHVYKSSALSAAPVPAYDASGDLYVTSGGDSGAYMPAGSNALVKVTTNVTIGNAYHIQWDGSYFAVQSFAIIRHQREHTPEHVYRFSISGSTGTLAGVVNFVGWRARDAGKSWIAGNTMVATPAAAVTVWNYPGGGKSVKVLHPARKGRAVTVSIAS